MPVAYTDLWIPVGFLLIAILVFVLLLYRILRRSQVVRDDASLWKDRNYPCPQCGAIMEQGFIMAGRGIIWRPKDDKPIGTFAHIGQALDNTISPSLPPRQNMAWHCPRCRLILVDHDKLVKR